MASFYVTQCAVSKRGLWVSVSEAAHDCAVWELPYPKTSALEMGGLGVCSSLIKHCLAVCFTLEGKLVVSAWAAHQTHLTHSAADMP